MRKRGRNKHSNLFGMEIWNSRDSPNWLGMECLFYNPPTQQRETIMSSTYCDVSCLVIHKRWLANLLLALRVQMALKSGRFGCLGAHSTKTLINAKPTEERWFQLGLWQLGTGWLLLLLWIESVSSTYSLAKSRLSFGNVTLLFLSTSPWVYGYLCTNRFTIYWPDSSSSSRSEESPSGMLMMTGWVKWQMVGTWTQWVKGVEAEDRRTGSRWVTRKSLKWKFVTLFALKGICCGISTVLYFLMEHEGRCDDMEWIPEVRVKWLCNVQTVAFKEGLELFDWF